MSEVVEVEKPITASPSDWIRAELGDLIALEYGKSLSAEVRNPGAIPVYGSNGIVGWHDEPLVPSAGIIVGRKGTAGSVTVSDGPFWPIDTTYYVRPRQSVDSIWLAAILEHAKLHTLNEATGVPGLNRDKAYREPVLIPPLDEQRRIAEVLRSVDEAIAAAKLASIQSDEAFEGLLADLFARYPDTTTTLIDYCVEGGLQTGPFGSQLKAEDYSAEGLPVIMPIDLTPEGIDFSGAKKAPNSKAADLQRHILQPGDVLFARRGEIGRCGLYLEGDQEALCGTGCLRARLDISKVDPALAYFLIQSRQARDWLRAHAVGATMPNLNTSIIGDLPIPHIPAEDQPAWADALLMIEGTRRINQRTLVEMEKAKSMLMHDLLSGHVRVPA